MASVGNSVRKAIEDWIANDYEFAMLHACNAVDGTAAKLYPTLGSNARFTKLLRDNYDLLGPMAAPGINLTETRWPVKVLRPKAPGGQPDFADVVYGVHRCTHGHGAELPDGFELLSDASGADRHTRLQIADGKVKLSDRVIFGLLAVAVLEPVNIGQHVPDDYFLSYAGTQLLINQWWGKKADFLVRVRTEQLPNVKLDFTDWMIGKT